MIKFPEFANYLLLSSFIKNFEMVFQKQFLWFSNIYTDTADLELAIGFTTIILYQIHVIFKNKTNVLHLQYIETIQKKYEDR